MRRLLAVVGLLVACGDDTGPMCVVPDPGVVPAEVRTLAIGDAAGPWTDGQTVPLVMGGQGGFMVVPILSVAADALDTEDTLCALVTIVHDTEVEEAAPGAERLLVFTREGSAYVSPPIEDFLGFAPSPFVGNELTLEVTVTDRDSAFRSTGVVTIELGPPADRAP